MTPAAHTLTTCPKCGASVALTASEGLCPRCLIAGVLARSMSRGPETAALEDEPLVLKDGAPRRFGEYELTGTIARGGMGVVYRARHTRLNRLVALKMIRAGQFAGPAEVRRFRIEAEAAARLEHPNIVPIYEVGEHEGRPFFTMKLIEGGTLAAKLDSGAFWERGEMLPSPLLRIAMLMAAVARAVHFAHERGVLHRDLKPANILLQPDGDPMVSDFGLAKIAQADSDYTLPGSTMGTPAYMSPEQAAGRAREVTTASDTYSLGAILYHLLAGQPPFAAGTPLETLRCAAEEEPRPPHLLRPGIDRDLETICLKCLEKNPARRYRTAGALAEDLERWLRAEPIEARPVTPGERALKWAQRKPAHAALLMVSAVGAVAFVGLLLASERRLARERNYAQAQEQTALVQAARAAASEQHARLHLYAADISLAHHALEDGNLGLARRTLSAHVPVPNGAAPSQDLRGFEWHYLWRLSAGADVAVLRRHTRAVTALVFSPDGRNLASASRDGTVRFWELPSGATTAELPPPEGTRGLAEHAAVSAILAGSPEALGLLAGGERYDSLVMRTRPSTLGELRAADWSRDGQWLVTGGDGFFVRVWNTKVGAVEFVIPTQAARQITITPDSARLIIADAGTSTRFPADIRVYDLVTHLRIATFTNVHPCFALSSDGRTLVVAFEDGRLESRELTDGRVRWQSVLSTPPGALTLSPDGSTLAIIERDRETVQVFDTRQGEARGKLRAGRDRVWTLAFAPDNRTLATAGGDHAVRLWDLETLRQRACLRGHEDEVLALAYAPETGLLASAGKDNTVRLWSPDDQTGQPAAVVEAGTVVAVSPDGDALLTRDGAGRLFRRAVDGPGNAVVESTEKLFPLGFTDGGANIATLWREAGAGPGGILFSGVDGKRSFTPLNVQFAATNWHRVTTAAAGLFMIAENRGALHLLDLRGRELRAFPSGQRQPLHQFALSADGRRAVGQVWPRSFATWETATGSGSGWWKTSGGIVHAIALSPDGALLATGGDDNVVSIWNAATGARVTSLRAHKAEIRALTFAPDGRTLVSSGADLALKFWHVPTWRELLTVRGDEAANALQFAPDGTTLFASDPRRVVQVLRAR